MFLLTLFGLCFAADLFGQDTFPIKIEAAPRFRLPTENDGYQGFPDGRIIVLSKGQLVLMSRTGVAERPMKLPQPLLESPYPSLVEFHFRDERIGWVWGLSELWESQDGGAKWVRVVLPMVNSKAPIVDRLFFDSQRRRLLLICKFEFSPNSQRLCVYSRTLDQGPWRLEREMDGGRSRVKMIHALPQGLVVILSNDVLVWKAEGLWSAAVFPRRCNNARLSPYGQDLIYGGYFLNDRDGWLSADAGVLRTTDGGETWCNITSMNDRSGFSAIHFATALIGLAVHDLGSAMLTVDGGISWTAFDTSQRFAGIVSISNSEGWLVSTGGDFYHFGSGGP